MTQFTDPHYLGGQTAVNSPEAMAGMTRTPAHVGIAAAPILGILPGVLVSIPPPRTPSGPTPIPYSFLVIVNSSPYALLVSQGGVLTQIAAFTQDLVQVPNSDQAVTILPQVGSETLAPGVDASIYGTWYPNDPGGEYPAAIGAGDIPIGTNATLTTVQFPGTSPFGTINVTPVPAWVQAVGIKVNTSATYVDVLVTDIIGIIAETTLSDAQIWYVPINGQDLTITITANGGNLDGTWYVYGLIGPLFSPVIQPFGAGQGLSYAHGQQVPVNANVAAGATTTLINPPVPGNQIRIRSFSILPAAAPVAGVQATLKTSVAGTFLARRQYAATVNDALFPLPCDIWVPDRIVGTANVADGVAGQNGSAVTMLYTIQWELWPTNLSPA